MVSSEVIRRVRLKLDEVREEIRSLGLVYCSEDFEAAILRIVVSELRAVDLALRIVTERLEDGEDE